MNMINKLTVVYNTTCGESDINCLSEFDINCLSEFGVVGGSYGNYISSLFCCKYLCLYIVCPLIYMRPFNFLNNCMCSVSVHV